MKRVLTAFALFVALAAAPLQAQSLSEKLDDARLVSRIQIALAEDAVLRAFTFRVSTDDDVATVSGTVDTAEQRDRVATVVSTQDSVERVVNEVRVAGEEATVAPELPPVDAESEPVAAEPEPEAEPIYHSVRSGDTLGAIANRYGVTVSQIRQLNGLRGSRIRAGQRLRIK